MHLTCINLVILNPDFPLCPWQSPRESSKESAAWIPPLEETLTQMDWVVTWTLMILMRNQHWKHTLTQSWQQSEERRVIICITVRKMRHAFTSSKPGIWTQVCLQNVSSLPLNTTTPQRPQTAGYLEDGFIYMVCIKDYFCNFFEIGLKKKKTFA